MKKYKHLIFIPLGGLLVVLIMNIFSVTGYAPGIKLPIGWQGPYLWVLESNNYHDKGIPFNFYKSDQNNDSYWNNLALSLNGLSGIGLGAASVTITKKYGLKNK